jgi:hypothetical protein
VAINIPILSSLDTKGFDKAARQFKLLETNSQKAGFVLKKAFLPAATALGGLAIAGVGAAKMASDLNEETSKTRVVFDKASDSVIDFSKSAATALGQSQTEALKAAGTFGVLGKAAGLTGTDLKDMAVQFTTLASDLASFNNTTPEEAVLALGAGLRGESEPLRRFGILLNDATLRQKALELGLVKTTKEALTPQIKSLAAQAVILEQSSIAQGDFSRTADGAANQQRILNAQLKDAKTNLGKGFLPVMTLAVGLLSDFAGFARDNAPLIGAMAFAIGGLAAAVVIANTAMAAWGAISAVTTGINLALATSFTAVQVATVVGIATAVAGAAVLAGLAVKLKKSIPEAKGAKNATDLANKSQKEYEEMLKKSQVTQGNTGGTDKLIAKQNKAAAAAKKLKEELNDAKDVLRGQFADALTKANDVLDEAVKKFEDYKKSVADSVQGNFSFANAQRDAEENTKAIADAAADLAAAQVKVSKAITGTDPDALTEAYSELAVAQTKLDNLKKAPTTFLDNLRKDAAKVKNFGVLVNRLIAGGLSEAALNQVIAAGADAGTAIAEELLGSASGILEANALTADVKSIADAVGQNSAAKFYQAGVDAGTELVRGIQSVVDKYTIQLNAATTISQVQGLTTGFNNETNGIFNPSDFAAIDWSSIIGAIDFTGVGTLMADGGIVKASAGGTLAIIGEAGQDEAVIPLDQMSRYGLGGGGGGDIYLTVNALDPQAAAQSVVKALQSFNRTNGPVPVNVRSL